MGRKSDGGRKWRGSWQPWHWALVTIHLTSPVFGDDDLMMAMMMLLWRFGPLGSALAGAVALTSFQNNYIEILNLDSRF